MIASYNSPSIPLQQQSNSNAWHGLCRLDFLYFHTCHSNWFWMLGRTRLLVEDYLSNEISFTYDLEKTFTDWCMNPKCLKLVVHLAGIALKKSSASHQNGSAAATITINLHISKSSCICCTSWSDFVHHYDFNSISDSLGQVCYDIALSN